MRQRTRPPEESEPELGERVRWLRGRLLTWFGRNGRSFPWREPDRSPYEIVVAEILLQRTTAAGVARTYPPLIWRYPSWAALARSSPEELEAAIRPLGLWRRKARTLAHLALLIEEHDGEIPASRTALERLPGVGPYTASAVLALVHGRVEPFLDVNMARLLGRFFGLPTGAPNGDRSSLPLLGLRLVKGRHNLQVNWAVLDFAALVCRVRRPLCPECPLRTRCRYGAMTPSRPTPTPGAPSGSRSADGR